MKYTCFAFAIFLTGTPALLRADFTYQETTQMTGGSLMTMMKALGPFTRSAREPIVSTHIVKGNRMATITKDRISVIDLDKETITTIETARKTYTVMTFAQMKQAMEDAANRAKSESGKSDKPAENGSNDVQAKFKVSAKATGQTKTVQGLNAREMLLTMTMEGTNTKTGDSGNMDITTDGWYAPVPGYDEVKEFNKRLAAKLSYAFGSSMQQLVQTMSAQNGQSGNVSANMEELSKEMAKMDGVPVETHVSMGGTATPGASPNASTSSTSSAPPPPQQQAPQQSTSSAIASAALGRFGLGRKRKDDSQPPPQSTSSDAAPASSNGSAAGTLMEMTTTLTSFSSAPADTSQFEVPAGFKQVEPGARRGR